MSAIALLSLIGLALFLPALSSNEEDMADTPVDPEPLVEPEEREERIISELPLDPEPDPEPQPLVNPGVEGVGTPEADRITTQSDASVFGLEGNDTITANADGNGASVFGGEGEDLLLHEGRDDAGPLVMEGGAGNDTVIASEIEFSNPSTVDGGAGDDLLITELFTPVSELTVDTFTMGEGEDTLQITSLFGSDGPADFGLVARVTDFSPDEDVIVIDTNPFGGTSAEGLGTSISLTEDAAEGATDVNIRLLDDAGSAVFNGIVRLEGVIGLSASDIALSLSEVLTTGPSYLFTATSEA